MLGNAISCMPFLVMMSMVALMAPKGKAKAKAEGGKRKRDESQDDQGLKNVKVEKNEKGLYPAIPADELNKLNSRLTNFKNKGVTPSPDFHAMTRAGKREWFWETYRFNKDILYAKREETSTDSRSESSGTVEGWITKWQVAQLNGILPGVPDYESKVDALVKDLPSQQHSNSHLAGLGEMLYQYTHSKMKDVTEKNDRASTLSVKADLEKGSVKTACEDLGIAFASGSSVEVTISQWKQDWLDHLKEAEKEVPVNKKRLEEGEALMYRLKIGEQDNKVYQAMLPEITEKVEGFVALGKAYSSTLISLNLQANSLETAAEAAITLEQTKKDLETARNGFKTYVDKVKKFIGL